MQSKTRRCIMKKWSGGVLIVFLAFILLVSYSLIGKKSHSSSPKKQSLYEFFNPHSSEGKKDGSTDAKVNDYLSGGQSKRLVDTSNKSRPHFRNVEGLNDLYILSRNMTRGEHSDEWLVWDQMKFLFPRSDALPETAQGIKEAVTVLKDLLTMVDEYNSVLKLGDDGVRNENCPYFVSGTSTRNESSLEIPCGLVEDSSVTVIGIPGSRQDSFEIELIGSQLKEDRMPPIVLHYSVVLPGGNLTKEPLIVQNTWSEDFGWGEEEKCPDHGASGLLKIDGLVKCNTQIVRRTAEESKNSSRSVNRKLNNVSESEGSSHSSNTFQFVEGNPFTATLWAGNEGFHMTVNGRHETSFAYREQVEPWLVNRVRVKGGLTIVSILAKGLPVSEDVDFVVDAQKLKATPLSNKRILLMIGVFSAGNNFERRMALRRTWMQYDAIHSGVVAVRFFIGLHKNKEVNFNLWREAQAYGDIQLMPFVDYYSLLTYKTIAICIMGIKILPAKYIMKMDDDAFVRIDEVLSSLKGKASNGLIYGRISFESAPNRDKDNKWFISEEEWPHSSYPPWAHGPGYIISRDIAKFIVQGHQQKDLMLFKLEDVAVGIWINQYERNGHKIEYVNDDRFYNAGCESEYVLAHYQNPRLMLCLWEKLQKEHKPECCE